MNKFEIPWVSDRIVESHLPLITVQYIEDHEIHQPLIIPMVHVGGIFLH